jgi:thiol-disulfide isomerase/thioredoxin
LNDAGAVPHLDASGQEAYREFFEAGAHRAFVIAPGGTWAWKADAVSAEAATRDALQTCQQQAGSSCVPYAIDDRVAFDAQKWPTLWGPYPRRAEAGKARVGQERGNRFFDLAFKNPAGKAMKVSDLRGQVLLLHFWASWCPPCRREMPQLQQLHQALGGASGVQMVLLQVRESFATASQWAQQQQVALPLHDSGVKDRGGKFLTLADGGTLPDRALASTFPTTYILDRYGVVVFSHAGPIEGWVQYLPFLRDVAARSGK